MTSLLNKKAESSEEPELFEPSAMPAVPADEEAKGQRVKVKLPSKEVGVAKAMPQGLVKPEGKKVKLADDREEMRRLQEESRLLEETQKENDCERARLQHELREMKKRRRAEEPARKEEEKAKKKKAGDEAAAKKKKAEEQPRRRLMRRQPRRRLMRKQLRREPMRRQPGRRLNRRKSQAEKRRSPLRRL